MPEFLLSKLKRAKPSMRRRLLLYMGALAALLLFSLFAVLLLLGQLKSPREEMKKSLTFQMEAFRSDVTSLWRNVSVMGVHLSEDMTALIEERVKDFDALSGSADALEQLEASMLGPLCQYVQQADCSGGFVLLSVSLNPDAAADSFSGLYVQRSNAEHTTSDLLLYRGMADIGRQHRVMPHRKWAQEFCPADFPGLADQLEAASAPIERACRTTELLTLPGTTEQAILLSVPMVGADGRVYGLCGFSVNQTYFSAHHAQPSAVSSLACVLSDAAEGLDIQKGLLTYPAGGFCFVPDELLAEKSLRGGLSAFVGTELSFVGISEPFTVAAGDEAPHDLTVLIPKSDYDRALLKSRLEAAGVLMLLLFFAVSCCLFYTRRYLRPILRDIERLKDESGGTQMTFDELQPVSARLRSHEQTITVLETEKLDLQGQVEHMQSQVVDTQEQLDDSLAEIRRLAYLGKKELDPADYQKFLEGYAKLSSKELEICAALAKGLSARQCAEQTGNALSTIDTYRKRVYGKTNIHRVRQLRLCYALMQLEQAEQDK
ncbi:helix-turn-helix transcriptional regulator [Oscillibacter sp. MSJ-31]|uniref:helix-turn-helix domain-containing protein n=1 Tax=Oscillibacter sp. MSJ-31 TaxID=2841526 RepID=UPI001C0F6FBB|nr:helix-turn-helix transcriptional regulator [Oscillibacter sp. MSJ-31]